MNYIRLYIVFLMVLILSGCDPSNTVIMVVDNQTDEFFNLMYYSSGETNEEFEIPQNSKTQIFISSGISPQIPDWSIYDSILFISSTSYLMFKSNDIEKTFYNYDFWEQKTETTKRNGFKDEYTFQITNEDLN